jgi:hypothetical protein
MLAIASFVVMPAAADSGCAHDATPHQPTAASLILRVQHGSEMGHIKAGLVPPLMARLDIAAAEALPVSARVGALKAFINLVAHRPVRESTRNAQSILSCRHSRRSLL